MDISITWSSQDESPDLQGLLAPELSQTADVHLELRRFRAAETALLVAVVGTLGTGLGMALVFLLVGPATNIATMAVVGRDLGGRSLFVYLLSIAVVAVLFGLGTDMELGSPTWGGSVMEPGCRSELGIVSLGWALALTILMLNGLRLRFRKLKPNFAAP